MFFFSLMLSLSNIAIAAPTADEILAQIDQNMNYDTGGSTSDDRYKKRRSKSMK